MKKQINQIIMTLGFVVFVIGNIVLGLDVSVLDLSPLVHSGAVLATVFVFSKNEILKKTSYALAGLVGAYGVGWIAIAIEAENTGLIIASVGLIFLLVSALIYFVVAILEFFGFTKNSKNGVCVGNLSEVIMKYKAMQDEKIITEQEYEELKRKTFEVSELKTVSLDDLKKWKKLLDQQVITEEEFATMKAKVFEK